MMYGTLLPAPMIVPSDPSILKEVAKSGQDTGIHSWDHVEWQDRLDRLSESKIESLLRKAGNMYRKVLGTPSLCCAAPAWKTSLASLSVQDRMGLLYASDSRGESPFLPSLRGRVFRTPQIPTTLPTMDEILGRDGCTADNVNDIYMSLLTEGLNVHTVHAEMEGMSMLSKLDELVKRAKSEGAEFVTLKEEAVKLNKEELPICEMIQREIPGRAGAVSLQGGR
jgi:peptidoglycan/xylan/chitin deacetylase (PgdA/CDA1 family)